MVSLFLPNCPSTKKPVVESTSKNGPYEIGRKFLALLKGELEEGEYGTFQIDGYDIFSLEEKPVCQTYEDEESFFAKLVKSEPYVLVDLKKCPVLEYPAILRKLVEFCGETPLFLASPYSHNDFAIDSFGPIFEKGQDDRVAFDSFVDDLIDYKKAEPGSILPSIIPAPRKKIEIKILEPVIEEPVAPKPTKEEIKKARKKALYNFAYLFFATDFIVLCFLTALTYSSFDEASLSWARIVCPAMAGIFLVLGVFSLTFFGEMCIGKPERRPMLGLGTFFIFVLSLILGSILTAMTNANAWDGQQMAIFASLMYLYPVLGTGGLIYTKLKLKKKS